MRFVFILLLAGCSLFSPAPAPTAATGGGTAASSDQVPADAGYAASECVDVTDYIGCHGLYVIGCCSGEGCAYVVTDGSTAYAVYPCASTSDCSLAAKDVAAYCGGGGDTGYDTAR